MSASHIGLDWSDAALSACHASHGDRAPSLHQMPLFADSIRFGEPACDLVVNFVDVRETKGVEMISGRESFDPAKARIVQTARQNYVAVHPVPADDERRKAHADVKRDPRFLGQDRDRTVFLRHAQQFVEDRAHLRRLIRKMIDEFQAPAGVRLIAIGEGAPATRTPPHWRKPRRRTHRFESCRMRPAISTRPHASSARPLLMRHTLKPSTRTFFRSAPFRKTGRDEGLPRPSDR
jgi:hypothetical protein